MTDEEFARIVELGHELSGVEFKSPGPVSDGRLIAQVVKAMLDMCNRRDGGTVIIGVEENQGVLNQVGLSESEIAGWNYDAVADQVARYADPSISFALDVKEYEVSSYVVIEVEEFADIPVLCKRSYGDVLRDGACYVRPRRKPETSDILTQADMRDLLDLAIEKGVTQFLERARRVGLFSTPTVESPATDQELFDEQLGDLR